MPVSQSEIIQSHGLVGLNQLLLAGSSGGRVAACALVGVLAGSPEFHRNGARQGLVVNVAQLLGHDSARVRIGAAGASLTVHRFQSMHLT